MINLEKKNKHYQELLHLAGKLASASEKVIKSNVFNLSENIKIMQQALNKYDNQLIKEMN